MKNLFSFIAIIMALTVTLSSCKKDDNLAGPDPLRFDKNNLIFEATASSATVRILDAEEWASADYWGVNNVLIITAEGDTTQHTNTFEVKHTERSSFSMHVNPFVGECFQFERKGEELHIQLSENTGSERKFRLAINAGGAGQGEIWLTQKGK